VVTGRLDVDDLYQCAKCGGWHRLYIKYPEGSADDEARRLFFDSDRGGTFYAGRMREPPMDPTRWRRAYVTEPQGIYHLLTCFLACRLGAGARATRFRGACFANI
jgi:hypothetical protein